MIIHTLTGLRRHRIQKRLLRSTVLVLQVQVQVTGTEYDSRGGARDLHYTFWRDAVAEDLEQ